MEHLPLPEGVEHFISAPYEAPEEEWYDNLGFLDFPKRRGWTEEQLLGQFDNDDTHGLAKRSNPLHDEQFFQTWLFFGLVIDVLAMGGISVTTEDFLKPKGEHKARIIDTSNLPNLLVQWRTAIEEAEDPLVFKVVTTWEKLNEKFERVKTILNHFCLPDENDLSSRKKSPSPYWPVRDEISTTIIALVFSLRQAASVACQAGVDSAVGWPGARSKILTKRIEHKWCLAETTTALKDLSIDGHYYIAASPSPGAEYLDRHYNCLPQRCLNTMDEDLYFTRHANAPWHKQDCKTTIEYGGHLASDLSGSGWVDSVCKIIDKGAIPLALWKKEGRQLWSSEYQLSEQDIISNSPYVAISHVWADGMGNPGANWLPECQLERITHLIENIRWKSKEPSTTGGSSDMVCFWMDTLCIPVQAENKARRKQAIARRHLAFPDKMSHKLLTEYGLFKDLIHGVSRNDENKWMAYLALSNSMACRQTSRLADETVCLATLLVLDLEDLLAIPDKPDAEAAKQRMVIFLKHLKTFEAGLIFNNYERLAVPGFQWAPKSLLNFRSADTGTSDAVGIGNLQEMNGEWGLLVRFPGFVIKSFSNNLELLLDRPFAIKCRGSLYTNGKFFIIHLPPNNSRWAASDEYAVVLNKLPGVGDSLQAVIGPHRTELQDEVHVFEHRLIARVEVRDDLPPGIEEVKSNFLNRITQWFIR